MQYHTVYNVAVAGKTFTFFRFTFKDFVDRFRFLVSGIGPAHKVGIILE